MHRRLWPLLLLVCCTAATAQTALRQDLGGDSRPETAVLSQGQLVVRSPRRPPLRVPAPPGASGLEVAVLARQLALLAVVSADGSSRCRQFFRYVPGQLVPVPVEANDDDFADNRICSSAGARVRLADLSSDGRAELVVEEQNGPHTVRRRVWQYNGNAWNATPLLSGVTVEGVPVLPQLAGTYYRAEALAVLEQLQDLTPLRTSPALTVAFALEGAYRISLRSPGGGETGVLVSSGQRSLDLGRGEQILTLRVTAAGRRGRIFYDSTADFADPPLAVLGLGHTFDGLYRPAPYSPRWPTLETYIVQQVLAGLWNPFGNVGLIVRETLRIEPEVSGAAVHLSSRPGTSFTPNLLAAAAPYDLALLAPSGPALLVDLRGADFLALAPARCSPALEAAGRWGCQPLAAPVLYRRRDAPS